MEADYLVNLAAAKKPVEAVIEVRNNFFKTETGKQYINALFNL
jgi:hypothetical protein